MTDSFDPYFEWLGIEGGSQPPDHYRLLGLQQFESDTDLIGRAADTTMARVRRIRPGANLAAWSQVLDRLSVAKTCLLDPPSKQTYDEGLANGPPVDHPPSIFTISPGLGDLPLPTFEPTATKEPDWRQFPEDRTDLSEHSGEAIDDEEGIVPFDTQQATDVELPSLPPPESFETDDWAPIVAEKPISLSPIAVEPTPIAGVTAKSSHIGPTVAIAATLSVGLAGLFIYMISQRGLPARNSVASTDQLASQTSSEQQHSEEAADNLPGRKAGAKTIGPDAARGRDAKPSASGSQQAAKSGSEESKPEVDATKTAAFADAVERLRVCLAQRDLPTARKDLQTAADNTQTREDRDLVDRLRTAIENLTQFWDGIRTSMARLQAAEELVLKDTRLSVIEGDRDYLVVRLEGQNRRYEVATLPTPIVMLLAGQNFGKDPASKAIIGTFLAVDPAGDRALARQYLEEAGRAGFHSEILLLDLGSPSTLPPTREPDTELPVHNATGNILEDDTAALEQSMKAARSPTTYRDIVPKALALAKQAIEQDRFDIAKRLAALAVEAARKSNNAALSRQAMAVSQQVQAMQKKKNNRE